MSMLTPAMSSFYIGLYLVYTPTSVLTHAMSSFILITFPSNCDIAQWKERFNFELTDLTNLINLADLTDLTDLTD